MDIARTVLLSQLVSVGILTLVGLRAGEVAQRSLEDSLARESTAQRLTAEREVEVWTEFEAMRTGNRLGMLLAVLASCSVSALLSLHLTRRIRKLAILTDEAMADGEKSLEPLGGSDELSRFSERWCSAVTHLAQTREALEQRNQQLSSEVAQKTETQRALRESEARMQAIVMGAGEGIMTLDRDGRIRSFNRASEDMFGRAAEDVIGEEVSLLLGGSPPPALSLSEACTQGDPRAESIQRTELEGRRSDGERFPMEVSATHLHTSTHPLSTWICRDVSASKHARARLTASAVKQAVVADLGRRALEGDTPEQLIEHAIAEVTAALEADLSAVWRQAPGEEAVVLCAGAGWRADVVGRARISLDAGTYSQRILESREPVLITDIGADPGPQPPSLWQEEGIVSEVAVSIPGAEGLAEVLSAHSRRLQAFTTEDACFLQSVANVLAEAKRRRTSELALLEAQLAAESANRAKGEFLANMSHEIRTPVHGISGMGELLLQSNPTEEQKEYVDTIIGCSKSLLGLINSLLDFSKIESGKFQLEHAPFDLRSCLEEAIATVAPGAAQKRIDLFDNLPEGVPTHVEGDDLRLRQVLVNLAANAVKFTDHGEVELGVEVIELSSSHVTLRFKVRDTGMGIPLEKQRTIFEEFVQADASVTRRHGGTGLGLAISRQLVEMMGGELLVQSQEGQGSVFSFGIEFERAPEATQGHGHGALPVGLLEELSGRRVLVIDGHVRRRWIQAERLRAWGLLVLEVEHGQDALQLLADAQRAGREIELVLFDLDSSGWGPEDFVYAIREEPAHGAPRVLLQTSIALGALERAHKLPGDGVLIRPIRRDAMLCAVAKCLASRDSNELMAELSAGLASPRGEAMTRRARDLETMEAPLEEAGLRFGEALARFEDDVELYAEALECYLDEAKVSVASVRMALASDAGSEVAAAARELLGASITMGAHHVAGLAERLARTTAINDLHEAPDLLDAMEERLRALQASLGTLHEWNQPT